MITNEAIKECIEDLREELRVIRQVQTFSRCWAGNDTALLNLGRRDTEVCRAIHFLFLHLVD